MNLLSVNLARSIWLGPISDFNPRGTSFYEILFPLLVKTYKFKKFPSLSEIADLSKGVVFEGGQFVVDEDRPIIVSLIFYNDGILADTASSTTHSDAFLMDASERISQVIKIPNYETIIRKRLYLSQVYVNTKKSLELINPQMKLISQYLSNTVEDGNKSFQMGGIHFMPDQVSKVDPAPFRFERATGVSFDENRYYSVAPLPTDKHLELLSMLEGILGD